MLDGDEGGERGGAEIWVQSEGLVGIDVEALEVDDFLAEKYASVGGGGGGKGGKRMAVEREGGGWSFGWFRGLRYEKEGLSWEMGPCGHRR